MASGIRVLLVDALNLIRRVYAAQEGSDMTERGLVSSARSLGRAVDELVPSHAVVVFESSGPTWRHRLLPSYRSGHKPMPDELRRSLPEYRQRFLSLGLRSFELEGFEADDVIATLAVKVAAAGGHAFILSTDKIFLQLVGGRIHVRDHFARRNLEPAAVHARYGVDPSRLLDLLALAGDSTNTIPGVPGVGPKTAAKLLTEYGTLERLFEAAGEQLSAGSRGASSHLTPKLTERLVAHSDDAHLARRLIALKTDLELGLNLKDLRIPTSR